MSGETSDRDEHGDVAQGAHDPARTDGVADRLLDAVPLGDLEVVAHALERPRRDAHDDVVGAGQGLAAIGGGLHGDAHPGEADDMADEVGHVGEGLGIDVLQDDLGLGERGRVDDVEEELRDPLQARAADDHDPRRHRPSRLRNLYLTRTSARLQPPHQMVRFDPIGARNCTIRWVRVALVRS